MRPDTTDGGAGALSPEKESDESMSGGRIQDGGALLDHLRTQARQQETALNYIRRLGREGAPAQVLDAAIEVFALATSMPRRQVREMVSGTSR